MAYRWPTAVDLFSGVGGLTLGLRRARFRVVGAVEIDPVAAETYLANFPSVPVWEQDIAEIDPAEVMKKLGLGEGELGLLAGCPPCQGFSTIRTRQGRTVRDPRNGLVRDYLRFVEAFSPKTFLMENVPGLANYGVFRSVLRTLRGLGYTVRSEVRNAAEFGVPQRRRRLIVSGSLVGCPESPGGSSGTRTVAQAIGHLPQAGRSGDALHDFPETRSDRVASIIRRIPKDGGSRADLGADQLDCHQRTDGFKDVYGRMSWDQVAPTITGGCVNPSKGRFLHPHEDRTITLREALILQGFPEDYFLSLRAGKFAAAQMIGNAVPPQLVEPHARLLRHDALDGSPAA